MRARAARHSDAVDILTGLAGLAALLAGTAVYTVLRPALLPNTSGTIQIALGVAPTFLHVLAFALLAAAATGSDLGGAARFCATWAVINLLFEVGQHADVAVVLERNLLGLCGWAAPCVASAAYFTRGRFDAGDLCAAIAGGLAAYGALRWLQSGTRTLGATR